MNKETTRLRISEATGNFLLENVHYSLHGTKHLDDAKAHLKSGGSVLFYFNHFAKLDPILYGRIANKMAPYSDIAAVTSFRHMDPKRGPFNAIQRQLLKDWEQIFGMNIIPVIQEKDKGENEKGITHYPDADNFNLSATKMHLNLDV